MSAALVHAAVRLVPVAVALAVAVGANRLVAGKGAGSWLLVAAVAVAGLLLTDRYAQRWLPLAPLLRLSMVFPGPAPSRLRVARAAAGLGNLQQRTEEARRRGLSDTPAEAAETVITLATAMRYHDVRCRGHAERVHVYADLLAQQLRLSDLERDRLRWAALLHDVGKIELSAGLLNNPGQPDAAEWEELRRHPVEGARFTLPLRDWLGEWWAAIGEHHERFDGNGYPSGLSGTAIARAARIVAVADAYDTMTAARPHAPPLTPIAACSELARNAGTQFDPAMVRAFLAIPPSQLRRASGWWGTAVRIPLARRLLGLRQTVPTTQRSQREPVPARRAS